MRLEQIHLLSMHTLHQRLNSSGTRWMIGVLGGLLLFAMATAYLNVQQRQHINEEYSHEARESWVNNPDKHPHRMAHYGHFAFRQKYPLSFFDVGMDSYVGNAVFLEAHRQNTINFSEASLSNSLIRFGDISVGLVLQLLLPLLIFFWGFSLVSGEREEGILRVVLSQGVGWSEIILGKSLGLFYVSLTILLPAFLLSLVLLVLMPHVGEVAGLWLNFAGLFIAYLMYLFIVSVFAVLISAYNKTSRGAIVQLIACWLLFTLILPKISQVAGETMYPSVSKVEFDAAVEHELTQIGDSHDPDDPYFKFIKDSLLTAHNVETTKDLPFNYGGFVMREGEKLSTEVFRRHKEALMSRYEKQQNIIRWTAFVNPYIGIKNLSMAFSGTDYAAYRHFNEQGEIYRYGLAQTMNNLQIKLVSNKTSSSSDKRSAISRQYWADFPDFEQQFLSFRQVLRNEWVSLVALGVWFFGLVFGVGVFEG